MKQLLKHTAMRSRFNSGPNYKHVSYPSHTISLYCRFPYWFCASLFLVCLLVAYAMRQTHTHTLPQPPSPQSNELLFCFGFSAADPLQMTSPYQAAGRDSGFICVFHYGVYAGVGWRGRSPAHIGEEPNLSLS